jgi:hypothetical protein
MRKIRPLYAGGIIMAYEFESELEDEFEEELEGETEDELEGEEFLGGILGEEEGFFGDLLGESEDFLGEGEDEFEEEDEDEYELAGGPNPVRKIYPDAVMEHLGELAAESESEDEAAEHFLPLVGMAASKLLPVVAKALAPAAKRALPKIARVLTRATPRLTRGIGRVAKVLHRNPRTRHLLRVVPGIARRTVGTLAHSAARGRRITPKTAVRTLARQARRVLGSPKYRANALRRHQLLERRFHRHGGHRFARPHLYRGGVAPQAAGRYMPQAAGTYMRRGRPGVTKPVYGGRPTRTGPSGYGGCPHCCCCRMR